MTNAVRVICIPKCPMRLIAGMTGSGKSILLHTITTGILMQASRKACACSSSILNKRNSSSTRAFLICCGRLSPTRGGRLVLEWAVENRPAQSRVGGCACTQHRRLSPEASGTGRSGDYSLKERLPYIVILIDELQHLMMTAPDEVEKAICKIASSRERQAST